MVTKQKVYISFNNLKNMKFKSKIAILTALGLLYMGFRFVNSPSNQRRQAETTRQCNGYVVSNDRNAQSISSKCAVTPKEFAEIVNESGQNHLEKKIAHTDYHTNYNQRVDSRNDEKIRYNQDHIKALVLQSSKIHGINSKFALAIAKAETNLRNGKKSEKDAYGVMQLLVDTARLYDPSAKADRLRYDPAYNVDIGVQHLKYLMRLIGSEDKDLERVAAAYNAGEKNLEYSVRCGNSRYKCIPETRNFVKTVLAYYNDNDS